MHGASELFWLSFAVRARRLKRSSWTWGLCCYGKLWFTMLGLWNLYCRACWKCGVGLIHKPPYSPDFSTCELCFCQIKGFLQWHQLLAENETKIAIADGILEITPRQFRSFLICEAHAQHKLSWVVGKCVAWSMGCKLYANEVRLQLTFKLLTIFKKKNVLKVKITVKLSEAYPSRLH